MSDSEDDFAPSKPAPADSDDDFAPSKPEPEPKPKLKGEEKKAQETKEFDEICEQGMAHVEEEEWKDATLCFERALKLDAKTDGTKEVSEERADCAFNLACCHAQCDRLDDAETWLRRAVAWGVRDVDLMKDKHLAPLRAHDVALCMNLMEALRPAPVRQAAVLQRSRRQRSGGAMAALIRQEKERQAANEDEDIDDFWKDEKDDDEYSGSAESEHERRDVFDSDFDEDESERERKTKAAAKVIQRHIATEVQVFRCKVCTNAAKVNFLFAYRSKQDKVLQAIGSLQTLLVEKAEGDIRMGTAPPTVLEDQLQKLLTRLGDGNV